MSDQARREMRPKVGDRVGVYVGRGDEPPPGFTMSPVSPLAWRTWREGDRYPETLGGFYHAGTVTSAGETLRPVKSKRVHG